MKGGEGSVTKKPAGGMESFPPPVAELFRPAVPIEGEGVRRVVGDLPTQYHYSMNPEDREYGFQLTMENLTLRWVVIASVGWLFCVIFIGW